MRDTLHQVVIVDPTQHVSLSLSTRIALAIYITIFPFLRQTEKSFDKIYSTECDVRHVNSQRPSFPVLRRTNDDSRVSGIELG